MSNSVIRGFIATLLYLIFSGASVPVMAADDSLPLPIKGYHERGVPMTAKWKEAGEGYSNPKKYVPPKVERAGPDCVKCHTVLTPQAVKDWEESKHFEKDVGCESCHNDHTNLIMPTPDTCGTCHATQVMQHQSGKHSIAWSKKVASGGKNNGAGRFLAQYEEMKEASCAGCHSVEDKCDSCHTRHRFNPKEALEPAACGTCHMGPDHSQLEYYEASKHGVIYEIEGKGYEEGGRAPTCVTCHMEEGNHDVSQGLTLGGASQGKFIGKKDSGAGYSKNPNGILMNEITPLIFKQERNKMVQICMKCHSKRFAEHKLSVADGIKIASDAVVGEAINILTGLYNDGLLNPMPEDRPENPFVGQKLMLTGHQLYEQTSGIEALFFEMYKFDLIHAWKGAYHFSPDWTHWFGNAPMKMKYSRIQNEANQLRRLHNLEEAAGIEAEKVEY